MDASDSTRWRAVKNLTFFNFDYDLNRRERERERERNLTIYTTGIKLCVFAER